jgi:hypothetical protein
MEWKDHDTWAEKLGIPTEISREVNNLVDALNTEEGLYAEFEQNKKELSDSAIDEKASGNTALESVLAVNMGSHDASQKKTTDAKMEASAKLEFLQQKGDKHVRAWYLHHYLDYLNEKSEPGDTVEGLLNKYRRDKFPQIHSKEIEEFLLTHADELAPELGI